MIAETKVPSTAPATLGEVDATASHQGARVPPLRHAPVVIRDETPPAPAPSRQRARVVQGFYGAQAGLLLATLIAQCILTHREGRSLANTFSYFTIQSNVLVLVTATILAVRPNVAGAAWRVVRLAALAGITVTGLVYVTVLAPYIHLTGWAEAYNVVFHYVMPISTVVGFVLVGPRRRFTRRDMVFLAWPVLWLAYTMLRGALLRPEFTGFSSAPSHYPYEFLDVDRVPLAEVVGSVLVVTLILVGVGAGYIALSRKLTPDGGR